MCSVLIVDDDASIRFAMADYFTAKGLRADSVESREDAEARLAEGHYGIVITDLRLTPYDDAEGLEVVRVVTERHPGTVCIVLTAYGSPDSEAAARRYGASAFLHKPRPMTELLAIVTRLLGCGPACPGARRDGNERPEAPVIGTSARARVSGSANRPSAFALALALWLGGATGHAQAATPTPGDATARAGDRPWSFDVGGRIQLDHDTFDGVYSENGDSVSETYLRRARIEFSGRAFEHWKFGADIAPLANGAGVLDTLIAAYSGFGPFEISAGRFKPDFSLEEATSSKWLTGIERSAIWDLAPDAADRSGSWGVELRTHGQRHHASVGYYKKPDHHAQAARVVFAPLLARERVLHLGLSLSREAVGAGDGRIRTRLGVRGVTEGERGNRTTLARAVDGVDGAFDTDHSAVLEFAYAHGPLSVQAEVLQRRLRGAGDQPGRSARGQYVQLAYTVTGEPRPYEIDGGKFDEIRPADAAKGAWEVFYRHDRLAVDGEPGLIGGGRSQARAQVHALGANWYVNRKLKLSVNHLWGRTDGIGNDAAQTRGHGLGVRLQVLL